MTPTMQYAAFQSVQYAPIIGQPQVQPQYARRRAGYATMGQFGQPSTISFTTSNGGITQFTVISPNPASHLASHSASPIPQPVQYAHGIGQPQVQPQYMLAASPTPGYNNVGQFAQTPMLTAVGAGLSQVWQSFTPSPSRQIQPVTTMNYTTPSGPDGRTYSRFEIVSPNQRSRSASHNPQPVQYAHAIGQPQVQPQYMPAASPAPGYNSVGQFAQTPTLTVGAGLSQVQSFIPSPSSLIQSITTMIYTTRPGPDGRTVYTQFTAVSEAYQTPQGVVTIIQWIYAGETSVLPQNAQPANATASQSAIRPISVDLSMANISF